MFSHLKSLGQCFREVTVASQGKQCGAHSEISLPLPRSSIERAKGATQTVAIGISEVISGDLQVEEILSCSSISPGNLYNFAWERKSQ